MPPSTKLYESMTRVVAGDFVVRVWKSESVPTYGPSQDITDALQGSHPGEIRKTLEAIPDIAAYEILDANGNGLVAYFDWP